MSDLNNKQTPFEEQEEEMVSQEGETKNEK